MRRSRWGEWWLAHHRRPVVRGAGKLGYLALVRLLGASLRLPGVEALALRRGLAAGDWVPGGSDLDIAVVLAEGPGQEAAERLVRKRLRKLGRWFPVPVEAEIYGREEMESYLLRGDFRAREALREWRWLWGGPARTAERPAEGIVEDLLGEAFLQLQSLQRLLFRREPATRRETRHLFKYGADLLRLIDGVRRGELPPRGDRMAYLTGLGGPFAAVGDSVADGYRPLSSAQRREIVGEVWRRFDALCGELGDPEPCFQDPEPADCLGMPLFPLFARWLPLRALVVHGRWYAVAEALPEPEAAADLAAALGASGLPWLVLSPAMEGALVRTGFYWEVAFDRPALRMTAEGTTRAWPRLGAGAERALAARRASQAPCLRNERWGREIPSQ